MWEIRGGSFLEAFCLSHGLAADGTNLLCRLTEKHLEHRGSCDLLIQTHTLWDFKGDLHRLQEIITLMQTGFE